jgi:hypothetical protein
VILPPQLNASSEKLERHGLFLMEDSQNIFLWVGREAVPQLVADVFDLPNYQALRGGKVRPLSLFSAHPLLISNPPLLCVCVCVWE